MKDMGVVQAEVKLVTTMMSHLQLGNHNVMNVHANHPSFVRSGVHYSITNSLSLIACICSNNKSNKREIVSS